MCEGYIIALCLQRGLNLTQSLKRKGRGRNRDRK